jgi:transcriptional regulator with XRE-family HTH domain
VSCSLRRSTLLGKFANMVRTDRIDDYFSKRLKTERERRKWTQADIAKRLRGKGIHVTSTAIAKMEAEKPSLRRSVKISEAAGIAELFGVSLDSLLGRRVGVENDLSNALGALQHAAEKATWEIGVIHGYVQHGFTELEPYQFESRQDLDSEGHRALDALLAAQDALANVAMFRLPRRVAVKLQDEAIRAWLYEQIAEKMQEAGWADAEVKRWIDETQS